MLFFHFGSFPNSVQDFAHISPLGRVNTKAQGFKNECEDDETDKENVQFVETRENSPVSLEPTKEPFDFIAAAI